MLCLHIVQAAMVYVNMLHGKFKLNMHDRLALGSTEPIYTVEFDRPGSGLAGVRDGDVLVV